MTIKINVKPNDKIFKELGNNTYTFIESLAELIDNSLSAKYETKAVNITIEIGYFKSDKRVDYISIEDDAKGIDKDILPNAISPAALSGGKSLNEHGLGMKQAIAALGDLEYLKTKTEDIDYEMQVDEFKFGEVIVKTNKNVNYKSGTKIKIKNVSSLVPYTPQKYTQNIVVNLGAMYKRFLKPGNKQANITIILKNIDRDQKGNFFPDNEHRWEVKEVKPIYFHPNKRINEPVVINKRFSGRGWEARLTFGYAPTDYQYEEMGIEPPKNYDPYKVSINKQGLDIIRYDRVIKMHQLSEIGLIETKHNSYNAIRGEIDLIHGFTTAITKNNIIHDQNFSELITQIKEYLTKENLLRKKTYPDAIPEKLLKDRLFNHFTTSTLMRKSKVQTEFPIEGFGGFIDILADDEVWELKSDTASGQEVYQLFSYLDITGLEIGYLVAKDFLNSAKYAQEHINKTHNKNIYLITLDEFPILDPPTPEEIKNYY